LDYAPQITGRNFKAEENKNKETTFCNKELMGEDEIIERVKEGTGKIVLKRGLF